MSIAKTTPLSKKVTIEERARWVLWEDFRMDIMQSDIPIDVTVFKTHCVLRFNQLGVHSEHNELLKKLKDIVLIVTVVDDYFNVYQHEEASSSQGVSIMGSARDIKSLFERISFSNCFRIKGVVVID